MALNFKSVKEAIACLYRNCDAIQYLFSHRDDETGCLMINLVNDAKIPEQNIQKMDKYGLVYLDNGILELSSPLKDFLETILDTNRDYNTSAIRGDLERLEQEIDYYNKEDSAQKKEQHCKNIKNCIRRIRESIEFNIDACRKKVEHSYRNERNFTVKKTMLENINKSLDDIKSSITIFDRITRFDNADFVKIRRNPKMENFISETKSRIMDLSFSLDSTHKDIILYLKDIEYQQKVFDNIETLMELKSDQKLESCTDFQSFVENNGDLCIDPLPKLDIPYSLDFISDTPEVRQAIRDFNYYDKTWNNNTPKIAPPITLSDDEDIDYEEIFIPPYIGMITGFMGTNENLYQFVMEYQFEIEISRDKRRDIFCQLVALHFEYMQTTGEYGFDGEFNYLMIYPIKENGIHTN